MKISSSIKITKQRTKIISNTFRTLAICLISHRVVKEAGPANTLCIYSPNQLYAPRLKSPMELEIVCGPLEPCEEVKMIEFCVEGQEIGSSPKQQTNKKSTCNYPIIIFLGGIFLSAAFKALFLFYYIHNNNSNKAVLLLEKRQLETIWYPVTAE